MSADELFERLLAHTRIQADRMFRLLLVVQWGLAIALVLAQIVIGDVAPSRLWSASVGAGVLVAPALLATTRRPGRAITRHLVAATQMLFSGLLIQLTMGRTETHFHVFGSLAFLTFYRDWRVLVTATAAIAVDHVAAELAPSLVGSHAVLPWWNVLEHMAWVAFEVVVLGLAIHRSQLDMRRVADREAALRELNATIERQIADRTAELASSREQYRRVIEGTRAVAWELDPQIGIFHYLGPQVEGLFGYPLQRYDEPGFFMTIIHPDDVETMLADIARGIASGRDYENESRVIAADGRVLHIRSQVSVARDGDALLMRGLSLDITHHAALEAELRAAVKIDALARMAAGVAHEINTPLQYVGDNVRFLGKAGNRLLAALRGLGQLGATAPATLAERVAEACAPSRLDRLDRGIPAAIAAAEEGLAAVQRIVGALQSITNVRAVVGARTTADLAACLAPVVASAREQWPAVTFSTQLDASDEAVDVDASVIHQVVSGLLANAAEACMVAQRPDRRVFVGGRTRDGYVELRITDNGGGVPDAALARIWDPFFTTKGVGHGRGDGLHHLRSQVLRSGGRLECERTSGDGTTFLVQLPLARHQEHAA